MEPEATYSRSKINIKKKFFQLLVPTLLSGLAISLNEFVDSIIVAHLLGVDAMSMVGMASPVMFVFAVVYCILGMGGATVYAQFAGKQEEKESKKVFTIVFVVAILVSVVLTILGMVFLDSLCESLCDNPDLLSEFKSYVMVLVLSGVLIIPIQVFATFCPALGVPHIGTIVNIIANAVNLVMDVAYITLFATGLKGAAMATFTGYAVATIFLVIMIILKKIPFPVSRVEARDFKHLYDVAMRGAPSSIGQLGYLIKVAFCNEISMDIGGMTGIAVFTLCIQILSIVSIGISGIIGAMIPLGAALEGQRDFNGLKMLIQSVLKIQLAFNIVITLILELFPQAFCTLFNYEGENAEYAYIGIRIFSIMLVFRGFILVFMYYYQVVGRKVYAMVISAVDGFIGIIPVALILTPIFGINGLWLSFPIVAILMLVGIILVNVVIRLKSNGKYTGIMLYEREDEDVPVFDVSFRVGKDSVSAVVSSLRDFCNKNIDNKTTSYLVALSLEEMLVYTTENKAKKQRIENVDILVKIMPEDVIMDIRSLGAPLDPVSAAGEKYSNIDVLKKVASKLDYGYVVGMNQTRISIQMM